MRRLGDSTASVFGLAPLLWDHESPTNMTITQLLLVVCGCLAATILFVSAPRALKWMIGDDKGSIWLDAPRKKRK